MIMIAMVLAYLLGAIPSAYIVGKIYRGVDIRQFGSGNVGATNVFRVLGKGPGIVVLVCDILKGTLAVALLADILGVTGIWQRIVLAFCAIIGHNWTVFLNFKGGKGVATSLGVLIGFTIKFAAFRPVVIFTLLVFILSLLFTGLVSFSSILAAVFLPVIMVITEQPFELICLGAVFCVFVVLRHRPNIKRLLAGQEPRIKTPFVKKSGT